MTAHSKYIIVTIVITLSLILRGGLAVSDSTAPFPFSPILKQAMPENTPSANTYRRWMLRSIGFQTMVVLTKNYHAGFGYGGRLTTSFLDEHSNAITEIGFWGATHDTTDIAVLGLQETLTYELDKTDKIRGFAGITLGYFYLYRTDTEYRNGQIAARETKSNSFDVFFTYGAEFVMRDGSNLLLQMKYGITELSDELHIIAGLNFDPKRLRK